MQTSSNVIDLPRSVPAAVISEPMAPPPLADITLPEDRSERVLNPPVTVVLSASIGRAALAAAMADLIRVTDRRNNIEILSCVLLKGCGQALIAETTDFHMIARAEIAGEVPADFSTCVPAHMLAKLLKDHKSAAVLIEVTRTTTERLGKPPGVSERVRFDFDGFKITMTGSNPADWPQFEMGEALHSYTLPTAVLGCAMAKTYSSISSEETRYYLNGTYVHVPEHSKLRQGKLTFVSTDGHCMCRFEVDAPVGATPAMAGLILPRKAVLILDKLCKRKGQASYVMTEHRTAGRMRFRFGHLELATRTIDGTFPDYHRVIPSGNDKLARVDVAELKEKIGQVSRIHTGKCQSFVRMSFSDGNLELTCYGDSGESARAVIPADYSSGNLDIGFNHRYVLDILDLIESEVIEIKLADPGSPAIFAGADDQDKGVSWVLMPMRV